MPSWKSSCRAGGIGTGRDAGEIPFAAIFGKVESERPFVQIHAVTDTALGLEMPLYTDWGICTW